MEFQIYDWLEDHYIEPSTEESDDENNKKMGEFIIHVFGRTMDGKSVYAKITDFTPYFFIELPSNWISLDKTKIEIKLKQFKEYLLSYYNKKIWSKFKSTLLEITYIKAKKADGFTNDLEFKFARLTFNNADGMKKFRTFFEENEVDFEFKKYKFKTYEANLPPMFRCFHNRNISGCAWVETSEYRQIKKESLKESYCDIELEINWRNLNPIQKDINAPLRIASFDIECYSHDGQFPQANREKDKVIQIGVSYTYLGQSEPYRQYIACLNETAPFDEKTILKSFDDECNLFLDFKQELIDSDCDIITGYNIFYFDEKYLYDRAEQILGIKEEMSFMSKLKKRYCNFKEMKLASSALGENLLRFWDTPGRVHIDLMKDIQKTFSLSCYKLDYVAAHFIRGEVKNVKEIDNLIFELECYSVDDICLQDYIHLEVIKGFVSDEVGEKYIVTNIDKANKKLNVKSKDNNLLQDLKLAKETGGGKIFWSQAKDDVGPKEIFKFQKGSPQDRSIVAKYCVKDCKLVNLLINKLEVITKNIEMANVCSVPLSYLFIRGQGIKIFSLCLKEFKEKGYVFPVIKMQKLKICTVCNKETKGYCCPICKSRNLDEVESHDTYEGAIVFDPVPTVDYEAYVTKDYNSLYPSSIIQKNMSHETIVENEIYDNLPNIEYYNAQFVDSDGIIQYRRYAKKNNNLGVIPLILDKLLKERKIIKKLMEAEENPFKAKIYDAKQIALKVTANSLYGQLGAPTSPVCKRDIAACTTSTGREMLILGKKYDEEILPWLINGMKKALEENDNNKFMEFVKMELKNYTGEYAENFIKSLKKYLMEDIRYNTIQPVVRYGDSVIGDTPLLMRNKITNKIIIKKISDLGTKWTRMEEHGKEEKESCEITQYESWTEKGWTDITRVIRHKLSSSKKLYSINSNTGFVVVTDEHSLLDKDGNIIKPNEILNETKLLESFPPINYNTNELIKYNSLEKETNNQIFAASYYLYLIMNGNGKQPYVTYNNDNFIVSYNKQLNEQIIVCHWEKPEEYVYDLTTSNHHFQAGIGNIIVHNTDSNFSSYRFREDIEKIDDNESLILWKEIIAFSKELIKPYIPIEYQEKWCQLHDKYYGQDKITKLSLPASPDIQSVPKHWKTIIPIDERLKQYLKEYMEESYLSWLWTLQEIILKDYPNLDYKLNQWAQHQLGKIRVIANDYTDETIKSYSDRIKEINLQLRKLNEKIKKECLDLSSFSYEIEIKIKEQEEKQIIYNDLNNMHITIETKIKNFLSTILKEYWIQPWWDLVDGKKVFNVEFYKGGKAITDKRSLDLSMEMGKISGELIKSRLPFPHNFAYEKTFWPFLILCKKKYVGNKYENNPNKYKQDFMGIVLKRRDNAPIVKEICGGIIDILINKRDPIGAKTFLIKCLDDMFAGKYDIKYFLQSRTLKLKESYKDWTRIAHIYLSEKIALRDPGNKPQSGDRIEFAVIKVENDDPKKKLLQGELIETPTFIKQNNKEIDYLFYMTNQIQNPATQFLKLVDNKIEELFNEYKQKYDKPKKVKEPKEVKEKKPRVNKKIIKLEESIEEPVEEPVVKEPIEEPIVKEPVEESVEEPVVEEPVVEELVEEKPKKKSTKKIKELVEEKPVVEELVEEKPKKKSTKEIKELVEEELVEEEIVEEKPKKKLTKQIKNKLKEIEI